MPDPKLPQEPTWKLLAVSPDMMDTRFCNKRFPFRWRSSLAISAFEPDSDDVPEGLCEGRITFLKITATITGYQPSREETAAGHASFPNVPTEELSRIIDQYFGCYGALLSVAVFPNPSHHTNLAEFPHIIDVEPKTRDLVQAATETGEILTSSKSNVKTNKSLTHTESSETGYKLAAAFPKQAAGNTPIASAELTHKSTEAEQENWSVATDASRERQEKEGTVTQVSQLYNLLSSYHIATNRAQFLMLARPHTLQPTDHRTFVDGLRQIEGVQEFLVIVSRPADVRGLCIEALLETGHFPEGLIPERPQDEFDESHEEFRVTAFASNGLFSGSCTNIDTTHAVQSGWVVDTRSERGHDPGRPGMKEIANNDNVTNRTPQGYNYRRIDDATVEVTGRICGSGGWGPRWIFDRTYQVFTRSAQPKPNTGGAKVPIDRLLITSRGLCVCFRSGQGCPEVDPTVVIQPPQVVARIVAERPIVISRRVLTRSATDETRMPAIRELLSQIQNALSSSWRLPQRRSFDEAIGFLDSDYFKERIVNVLPREQLATQLDNVHALPRAVVESLGGTHTVGEALELDLTALSQKTGLSVAEAAKARRALLGIRGRE